MSDFKPQFKKSVLEHPTLAFGRFDPEKKRFFSLYVTMSGSAPHFCQWVADQTKPLRCRFDLNSVNEVEELVNRAVKDNSGLYFVAECSAKPRDSEKFHEGTLVVHKNQKGVVCMGIARPDQTPAQAKLYELLPNYFVRTGVYNKETNETKYNSAAENSAGFARRWIRGVINLARAVAVKDYKDNSGNQKQGGGKSSGNNNYSGGNNNNSSSPSVNDFDDDFGDGYN